jgi:transposase
VAFHLGFRGKTLSQVIAELDSHNSYTLRKQVSLYQRKVLTSLFISPARTRTQKRDVQALQQHNGELKQTLRKANVLTLALPTMMDMAKLLTKHSKRQV